MMVRIRMNGKRAADASRLRTIALGTASLLAPLSLVAFTVAFWGFAADLGWTKDFFISRGLFAHWQVWMATAGILLLVCRVLHNYATDTASDSSETSF